MFDKILIANRGEIACRVARTARRLGVRTVAVYSDADARSAHVAACDEAVHIGPAPATESYLDEAAVLEAARRTGAQAVHPGYGFLSENAGFARACADAGLVFIGPPVAAIEAMGSKSAAKAMMEAAGVPVVPGYHGDDQSLTRLETEAARVDFPILIKASAGGGGKGMRIVRAAAELADALAGAQREAQASFGDARVLIERYVGSPRHVEVQVFGDSHGNVLHLFERDCSVQRRYQKVIEEAPAPGLDPNLRSRLGEAAVQAARAVDYVGAGTIEFLLDDAGRFYFMEMNTRLQVEHPVTECVTGQDLVEWQLRVASGEPLPCGQDDLTISGHAFEARIYAEDPAREFMPSVGRLEVFALPQALPGVRVDSGVRAGDTVSSFYDPMLAKLIVHGPDRDSARRRMVQALGATDIAGIRGNVAFLRRIFEDAGFAAGGVDTHFLATAGDRLLDADSVAPAPVRALAALAAVDAARHAAVTAANPHSPWGLADAWRPNLPRRMEVRLGEGGSDHVIGVVLDQPIRIETGGVNITVSGFEVTGSRLEATLDGERVAATVLDAGGIRFVALEGRTFEFVLHDPDHEGEAGDDLLAALSAPMPGTVTAVKVVAGAQVKAGQELVAVEAMKMEHMIKAPADGVVTEVFFKVGDTVTEAAPLVSFEATAAE